VSWLPGLPSSADRKYRLADASSPIWAASLE
jgi:hypothetical protein